MKFLLENESYAFPPNLTGVSTKMILYIAITDGKDAFSISEIIHFPLHGLMKTRGTCSIGPSLPLFHQQTLCETSHTCFQSDSNSSSTGINFVSEISLDSQMDFHMLMS